MPDLNVNPTKEGIKLKCADIELLSALKNGSMMTKKELIESIKEGDHSSLVIGTTNTKQSKFSLNERLSENIGRGFVVYKGSEFGITDKGRERIDQLDEEVKNSTRSDLPPTLPNR